jgi:hypothetical protein
MISAPNVPARAIPKGMQLPRKNSEPNGILNFDRSKNLLNFYWPKADFDLQPFNLLSYTFNN